MKIGTIFAGLALILSLAVIFPAVGHSADALNWRSFGEGLALANAEGKKVFIHFRADWCRYCHQMDRETFRNPSVVAYLNENFIAVKVDTDKEQNVADMFGVRTLPDNWFVSEKGERLGYRQGYIPPATFIKILKSVKKQ